MTGKSAGRSIAQSISSIIGGVDHAIVRGRMSFRLGIRFLLSSKPSTQLLRTMYAIIVHSTTCPYNRYYVRHWEGGKKMANAHVDPPSHALRRTTYHVSPSSSLSFLFLMFFFTTISTSNQPAESMTL